MTCRRRICPLSITGRRLREIMSSTTERWRAIHDVALGRNKVWCEARFKVFNVRWSAALLFTSLILSAHHSAAQDPVQLSAPAST